MSEEEKKEKRSSEALQAIKNYSYKTVGKKIENRFKTIDLEMRLHQANMGMSPGLFLGLTFFTVMIVITVVFPVSILIFFLVFDLKMWLLWSLGLTPLAALITYGVFKLWIRYRISNRKMRLENELPYTLSELSILASTGIPPVETFRRMSQRDIDKVMKSEIKKVVYKVDVEGHDIITALGETAKESPSSKFRETLWDISNIIHQGGSMGEYLRDKSDEVLKLKRTIQKEFTETLMTYTDIYISLVLIGVLMISIGAFLIESMGETAMGLDANTLLLLLTYILIPIAVLIIGFLISSAYSKKS